MKSISLTKLVALGLLATFSISLGACGGEMKKSSFSAPSLGDDDDEDSGPASADGFSVSAAATDWPVTSLMHQFYNTASPCIVSPSATGAAASINCMLNIREADVYFSDTKLAINVPPGMCTYLGETPYSFWNERGGVGPSAIAITTNEAATPAVITSCQIGATAGTIVSGGAACNFPGTPSEGSITAAAVATCAYNHTAPTARNCCAGKYTLTHTKSGGTSPGTSTVAGDWGGTLGACIDGPGAFETWIQDAKQKVPLTKNTSAVKGINKTYTVKAPVKYIANNINLHVANFYGWTEYAANNHAAAAPPLPLSYKTDFSGTSVAYTSPAYQYDCLGPALEVKARIRVYLNEWDTSEAFTAYLGGSTSVSPNSALSDTEGNQCNPTGVSGDYCNDFYDWDSAGMAADFPGLQRESVSQ